MSDPLGRFLAAHGGGGTATLAPGQEHTPDPLDALLASHTPPPAASPDFWQQAKEGGADVLHAIESPWQTVKGIGKSIVGSAQDAFSDKVIGTVPGMQTVGPNEQLQIQKSLGQPLPRTTAQTPGAITPQRALLGMVNTASIPAYALAPELALPARIAVNSGLGAINKLDEPLRGAISGAALGEVLHAPHAIANVGDVSGGVSDAIREGAQEGVGKLSDEAQLWKEGRRPAATLPVNERLPVEPSPAAETVSAGGEAMDPLDKLLAARGYLSDRGRLDESGTIGRRPGPPPPVEPPPEAETQSFGTATVRRPAATLPMDQRLPVEPSPDAVTQSFGGRVGRRPGGDVAPQEAPGATEAPPAVPAPAVAPVEPPAAAQTVSAGGQEPSTIQPVVSANGTFEARPGVLRKVNADLGNEGGANPTAASLADQPDVTGTRSFVARETTPGTTPSNTPEPRPSDILNVAKLNLEDQTAEQRVAERLEQFRSMRDEQKQTFDEADVNRKAIMDELTAGNPKALSPAAAAKLSGEELLARRDVVNQNDQMIGALSKSIASGTMTAGEQDAATQLMEKAVEHNDALLKDLVTGSSQKGRDLNLLRRMANTDLDPATWLVQAKRMLGDKPLTDDMMSDIRRLIQTAVEACG